MRVWKLLVPIGLLLPLSACGPQLTLNPLFNENDIVLDDAVVGTWVASKATADTENEGSIFTFSKLGDKAYELTFAGDKEGSSFKSEVHLVRLGKFLFLDLYPVRSDEDPDHKDPEPFPTIGVHMFGRIWIEKEFVRIALLDDKWVEKIAAEKKLSLLSTRDGTVLNASTEELQELALQYAEDTKAFSPDIALCRAGPLAAGDCSKAVFQQKLETNDPEAWDSLGQEYFSAGRDDEALAAYQKAAQLDPSGGSDLHNYHHDIGRVFLKKAQYEQARKEFLEAHRLRPTDSTPDHQIGISYFLESRFEDAVRRFKTDPWDVSCDVEDCPARGHVVGRYRNNQAILSTLALRHIGRYEEAKKQLEAYTRQEEAFAEHRDRPEWEALLLSYEAGIAPEPELLGKAESFDEKSEAYFYVGYEYFLKGNKDKAREYFQKTLDTKVADSDEYIAAQARLAQLNSK